MRRLLIPALLVALGVLQAFDAMALGLARARGAVLLGRPLNVTIGATAEPGDPDVPCVEADVFQGDNRMSPGRVNVRWEPTGANAGNIRVTTQTVVEEPVVTLYLRVGCANKVTRRYVLLSEEPMDQEVAQPAPRAQPAQAVPALPIAPAAPAVPAPPAAAASMIATPLVPSAPPQAATTRREPAARSAPQVEPRRPAAERNTTQRAPVAAAAAKPKAGAQPRPARLQLEPLDLSADRDPSLRASERLQAEPGNDEERRRQAAAMWKALSAGPEESMRNSERLQALEKDVRSLGDLMRKNTAALELMREQTLKARSERNLVATFALVLLVLAALLALAWAWRRSRKAESRPSWWARVAEQPPEADDSDFVSVPPRPRPAAPAARKPAKAPVLQEPAADDLELDIPDSTPPARRADVAAAAAPKVTDSKPRFRTSGSRFQPSDFSASIPGSSRMMKAEELIDIQQQADFFLSIDQPERAIALLEGHIEHEEETSALVWMDLLEIYHDLGREDDYDRIRQGFHARFNAVVPPFRDYRNEQVGLENYGRAISRIASIWPSQRVLEVIEESLLRKPGSGDDEAFGLEAYRELVLLYNIGRDIADSSLADGGTEAPQLKVTEPPPRYGDTSAMSLPLDMGRPPPEVLTPQEIPWPSENLGLDIDLGDFSSSSRPEPTVQPKPAKPKSGDGGETDLDSLDWRSIR